MKKKMEITTLFLIQICFQCFSDVLSLIFIKAFDVISWYTLVILFSMIVSVRMVVLLKYNTKISKTIIVFNIISILLSLIIEFLSYTVAERKNIVYTWTSFEDLIIPFKTLCFLNYFLLIIMVFIFSIEKYHKLINKPGNILIPDWFV
ncbi:hypothetical protein EDEG_00554 [Edhazardia aedis USNM 41457]|uniref:Uncharacterized protein n=1 Tax=Edhazardia aedis (strain USNM 41457) TaxID=1003232 RepID=J9D028_EDHAE|nr:hypothetical protein EDEG_00554 [Edhazardia aedis USNM 41457]|eukprot:EJW01221.2 hypothetical protein EDEG_00554 [Edhazardia aedis USNM 41457]